MIQTFNDLISHISKVGTNDVQWASQKMGDEELETLIAAMEMSPIPVEQIDISRNEITSTGAAAFSRFIRKTPSVKEVQLQDNHIDDVGARTFLHLFSNPAHPKLFNIEGNPCSKACAHNLALLARSDTFPKEVQRALITGETDELNLTGVDYNKTDPRLVPFFVENMEGLKRLILSGCSLRDAGAGVVGALIKNAPLCHVDLSNNDISEVGLTQFIELSDLSNHQTITSLSFAHNIRIGNFTAQNLSKTLFQKNYKITFFDLSETSVTSKIRAIVDHECDLNKQPRLLKTVMVGISTNNPECTSINLQWEEGMEEAARFIAPVLKDNTHLLELNLGNCSLGDKGVQLLVEGIRQNNSIRAVVFPNNGITSTGAKLLFQCAQQRPKMEEVNLAGNRITDEAALSILSALRFNSSLKSINITNNYISADYMNEVEGLLLINQSPKTIQKLLAEIEANDSSLTKISLSGGTGDEYCNDASVKLLCQSLLLNRTVTLLDLSRNVVGDLGLTSIAEMLMTNTTLTHLNLSENSISNRGVQRLCDALRTNASIQELDLSNNVINDDGVEGFIDVLKFNERLEKISLKKTGVSEKMSTKITEAADLNKEPSNLKGAVYRLQKGDTQLSKLDLSRENCTRPLDDQSITTLCTHLRGRTFIESLILKGNSVGTEGCKSIGSLLSYPGCGIRLLDLSSNPVDDNGLRELASGLSSDYCVLEVLLLSETSVTSAGIDFLTTVLKQNKSLLEVDTPEGVSADSFCLMNRELMVNAQPKSLKPLLASIDANDAISTLVFRDPNVPFTDSACQLLSASLVKNDHITAVDLSHNQLTCDCMPFLLEALSRSTRITSVDLSHNRIDDRGGKSLVLFMRENDHVLSLALEGNTISSETLSTIDQLLSLNGGSVKLKKILLKHWTGKLKDEMIDLNAHDEFYKLTDNDVSLLCEVLAEATSIRAVDLGMNCITDVGCEMIADVLRQNHKIEALYLDYNPIGEAGGEALYNALKVNHRLHTLFLEGTNVPGEIWEDILSLLHVNETPLKERINMRDLNLEDVDDDTQFKSTDYATAQEEKVGDDALHLYLEPRKPLLLNN
ncbi:hypothetical protein DQ04_04181010 [Trypanosoma grayi]|uniref:hypothetical protein n=1 Tax=Trypanosoma grayi TaxID=71804 RepID=UPI0004F46A69|nr:hypothetical protein DQ04_04181010 [Trypanosoma grayi]KEG10096.1 hypothetical protein DQ04_04181010 [Trypanosoma grayi]